MDRNRTSILFFVIVLAILLSLLACTSNQDTANTSSSDNVTQPPTSATPPPVADTNRGNPKLEYVLVQLILAEKRGETVSFAQQSGIELRDSSVLVDIKCVPGQAEVAAKAAISAGATLVTTSGDWTGGYVPITSLDTLANEKSIYWITVADSGQPGR